MFSRLPCTKNRNLLLSEKTSRKSLEENYWHSAEAMQSSQGCQRFEEMLKYLANNKDASILTCKTPIQPSKKQSGGGRKDVSHVENARRDCIRELLAWAVHEVNNLAGVVFERRATQQDNDRDRKMLKRLKKDGVIPQELIPTWVTPSQEQALWVPDIVCMAYRRTRTHTDRTAQYFFEYLNDITEVREI